MSLRHGISWWDAQPSEAPLLEQTVGGLLQHTAAQFGDRSAVLVSAYEDLGLNVRWSYAELDERSDRVARALLARGIRHGDRVAVWAPNVPEWLVVEFAAAKIGAVLVTVNPTFRTDDVRFVLEHSEAAACLFVPSIRHFDLWRHLREVRSHLPRLGALYSLTEAIDDVPGIDELYALGDRVDGNDLTKRQSEVSPGDIAQIQYTSGTTGRPKGAMLSHASLINNAREVARRAALTAEDRWCNPMPFFHTAGCAMVTLGVVSVGAAQCPLVWFDPDRVLATIHREACTVIVCVPTMYASLLERAREAPHRRLDSLRLAIVGGSPTPITLGRRIAEEWGTALRIVYGLTETSPIVAQGALDEPGDKGFTTVGKPLPWTDVRVVDPSSGRPVPVGTAGELQVRGYLVMGGYFRQPEATAAAIDTDGWFRTGDLGTMDAEGYVNIVGRIKDMIIRGGENLYATEIENLLVQHPAVLEACVVGVPDAYYGEEVCAVLRLRPEMSATAEEVQQFVRERVTHQKVPRYVRFTDAYPLTASGKVQKFAVRDSMIEALGLRELASIKTA